MKEKIAMWAAYNLVPRSVRYWVFIRVGAENIHSNEVVPDVRYCDVLSRLHKA